MRWFVFTALCIAMLGCSENARSIIPGDKDALPNDNGLLGDSDELLTDDPMTDDPVTDTTDAKPEGGNGDGDILNDTDIPVTDDGTIVPSDDDSIQPDETGDEILPSDDDTVQPDEPITDDGTMITDDATVVTDDGQPDVDTVTPYCGDGIKNGSEACDDGDALNGTYDHCNSICTGPGPRCGDGNKDTGYESCDDGTDNGAYGFCNSDCSGLGLRCGDGITQNEEGELCDDGVDNGTYNHCNIDCSGMGSYCGDGVVDDADGEECDQSNDQYCSIPGSSGCDPNAQYRLRECDNDNCIWTDWSGCGNENGQNADNTGDCADTNC